MAIRTIYLDNNATTQPSAAVREAVNEALERLWANPSSVHREGQRARYSLELARKALAELIEVAPKELILTSGGTESINLAIRGVLEAKNLTALPASPANPVSQQSARANIITTPLEHAAVRELCEHLSQQGRGGEGDDGGEGGVGNTGVEVRLLPLDEAGRVDASALENLIDEHTTLVSVAWANNETGAIQPVEAIHAICKARGVPMHCDAVQWVGKMPMPADSDLPCDLLTFSAHKFHGPKGVGGLWVRPGVGCVPQMLGAQEMGRRGGTEALASIVGAGVAAQEAMSWLADEHARTAQAQLRDRFEEEMCARVPGAVVNASSGPRIWNTTNIGFPGLEAEALLVILSEQGVCVSAGSACSSGSLDPSPVLLAMGIPEPIAHGSIRVSLSKHTTKDELDRALHILLDAVARLGRSGI